MIDESFHLTPLDVRRYEFGTSLRGYDRASVDQFRARVADELEALTLKNQDLEAKARSFHEQLRAFRERDKALNDALITAQQLRGDIREQAEREGLLILREARAEGERIVADARAHVRSLSAEVDSLDRTRRQYLAQMRIFVERQLAELDAVGASGPPARPHARRAPRRRALGRERRAVDATHAALPRGHRRGVSATVEARPAAAAAGSLRGRVDAAAETVRARFVRAPEAALILGTGLGGLPREMDVEVALGYESIPGFPRSTVESHAGRLLCGTLGGRTVIAMQGRAHQYEGYSLAEVAFPVRVLGALGAPVLLVSNACGGMHPLWAPGDLMLIADHINLLGDNPLVGEHDASFGARFPDMSKPYAERLRAVARAVAARQGARCWEGVVRGVPAQPRDAREYRMLRRSARTSSACHRARGDRAVHGGMRVLGSRSSPTSACPTRSSRVDAWSRSSRRRRAEPRLALVRGVLGAL
jgi:purine-nucleoside phosphorylase